MTSLLSGFVLTCCRIILMALACWLIPTPGLADTLKAPPQLRRSPPRAVTDDVFYFVLLDRFANGDPSNDRGGEPEPSGGDSLDDRLRHGYWPQNPSFFHGGDLKGLTGRLDYLQNLGVTALWLSPVMKNLPVQHQEKGEGAVAGYHGYYITDFTTVDPHLGSEDDLRALIQEAHERNMKVFLDIVVNHTADVIRYKECQPCPYRGTGDHPQKAYTPFIPPGLEQIKKPMWLNDPQFYNNRGNSTFSGESSLLGDFHELDDLRTSDPQVVSGMIDIYTSWIRRFRVDGFRLDTVKHVEPSFWRQFVPAVKKAAVDEGILDFFVFGEVYSSDVSVLADAALGGSLDSVLDFAGQGAMRAVVTAKSTPAGERGASADDESQSLYARILEQDDHYRQGFSPQHLLAFLSNHDLGRMGGFLKEAGVPQAEWLPRMVLAHTLLFFGRGVPVLYYGDEQGFLGAGPDAGARQDMWAVSDPVERIGDVHDPEAPARVPYSENHPLYKALAELARTYQRVPALRTGEHFSLKRGVDFSAPVSVQAFRRAVRKEWIPEASKTDVTSPRDVSVFLNWSAAATRVQLPMRPKVVYSWPSGAGKSVPMKVKGRQKLQWTDQLEMPAFSVLVVESGQHVAAAGSPQGAGDADTQQKIDSSADWSGLYLSGLKPGKRVSGRVALRLNVPDSLVPQIESVKFSCFAEVPTAFERGRSCDPKGGDQVADPTPPFQAFLDLAGGGNGTPIRIEAHVMPAQDGRSAAGDRLKAMHTISLPLVIDERLPNVAVLYSNPAGATHVQLAADNGYVGVLQALQPAAEALGGSFRATKEPGPSVSPSALPLASSVPGRSAFVQAARDSKASYHTFLWPQGARYVQLTYLRFESQSGGASLGSVSDAQAIRIDRPVIVDLDDDVFPLAIEVEPVLRQNESKGMVDATDAREGSLSALILVDPSGRIADGTTGPGLPATTLGPSRLQPEVKAGAITNGSGDVSAAAFWSGLFLRGAMNAWEARDPLAPVGSYALAEKALTLTVGRVEFKIADKDWTAQRNFGSPVGVQGFVSSGQSGNLFVDLPPGQEGLYRFVFGKFSSGEAGSESGSAPTPTTGLYESIQLFVMRPTFSAFESKQK